MKMRYIKLAFFLIIAIILLYDHMNAFFSRPIPSFFNISLYNYGISNLLLNFNEIGILQMVSQNGKIGYAAFAFLNIITCTIWAWSSFRNNSRSWWKTHLGFVLFIMGIALMESISRLFIIGRVIDSVDTNLAGMYPFSYVIITLIISAGLFIASYFLSFRKNGKSKD
ncbi:MAG: hypothetical protein ABIE07_00985 [Candidatus Zixiibacteriota bacterium]